MGYFQYFHKFELLGGYLEILADWPTWQEDISTWPENVTVGRETVFPISENVFRILKTWQTLRPDGLSPIFRQILASM